MKFYVQWKFIGNHMTNKLLSTLNGTMALARYTFSIICLILLAGISCVCVSFYSFWPSSNLSIKMNVPPFVFLVLHIFTKPIKLIFMWQMHGKMKNRKNCHQHTHSHTHTHNGPWHLDTLSAGVINNVFNNNSCWEWCCFFLSSGPHWSAY